MIDQHRIRSLSLLFGVREDIIERLVTEKKDLYEGIAEVLGRSRQDVKRAAYTIMYSTTKGDESNDNRENIEEMEEGSV